MTFSLRLLWIVALTQVVGVAFLSSPSALAQGSLEAKWSQLYEAQSGENIASDLDWREVMLPREERTSETWIVADDFISDGRPITSVRWWGSYFDDQFLPEEQDGSAKPTAEDAYVISFLRHDGSVQPMELLASYIADENDVQVKNTGDFGADGHQIWMYEVELARTHLDHAMDDAAQPDAFLEIQGEHYWLSIAAENGHEMEPDTWEFIDNEDEVITEHFWGWHTSFVQELNPAVMGHLDMFGEEWHYSEWEPVEPEFGEDNMAFELLTPVGLPGDCNSDGVVNAADLECACQHGVLDQVLQALGWAASPPGRGHGDFDGDGTVSFGDFLVLSGNFGKSPATYAEGDCDCNNTVDFADFLKMSANFGTVAPPPPSTSAVPEPPGSLTMVSAFIFWFWRSSSFRGLSRRRRLRRTFVEVATIPTRDYVAQLSSIRESIIQRKTILEGAIESTH